MTPLRWTERFERPINPARVVPGTATSRLNSRSAAETPGGASTDLSVPTTGRFTAGPLMIHNNQTKRRASLGADTNEFLPYQLSMVV